MYKLYNIQLFSEEVTGAEGTAVVDTGKQQDTGEPEGKKTAEDGNKDEQNPKYTDKELDEIIGKKFAKWQTQQQKAVDEAKKLAEMNAQQKAEYERDQLQKELNALKKQASIAEMTKTARKMLSDDGISVSDDLLSMLVNDDAETTKAAVDGFKKAFSDAVEYAVKERLKGEPPRRGSGGAASMTKEQIMAIRDPELRQKKMLENKHLFNF